MKRFTLIFLLLVLTVMLFACQNSSDSTSDQGIDPQPDVTTAEDGGKDTATTQGGEDTAADSKDTSTEGEDDQPEGNGFINSSPAEMLDTLVGGANTGLSGLVTEQINLRDKDNFQYHFFVPLTSAVTAGAICQPMIGSVPFFVGILKTNTAEEAKALAEDILDNVNYRKLVCAAFEKAYTRAVGNTVILIMDIDANRATAMVERFDTLAAK